MHVALRTEERVNLDEPKTTLVVKFVEIEITSYAHEFSWK